MEEGDLVLCTVEKILGTTVFVKLASGEKGTLITSEIAPGRIRNLREYVVPNKKIVCKVLRIRGDQINLSLRRVSSKEKKDILTKLKQEQSSKSGLHQILKDKAEGVEKKILEKFDSLFEFLSSAREDEKLVKTYIPAEFHEAIKKLTQKKRKDVEVKKLIELKCLEDDGVNKIKKMLNVSDDKVKISYLSAGKFQVVLKQENYKKANQEIDVVLEKLEDSAKKNSCEFEIIEK